MTKKKAPKEDVPCKDCGGKILDELVADLCAHCVDRRCSTQPDLSAACKRMLCEAGATHKSRTFFGFVPTDVVREMQRVVNEAEPRRISGG